MVGEADAPSHNYDATGRRGSADDFLLVGKSNAEGALLGESIDGERMTIPLRFKGKRANKKFGRYGKRGGNRKLNYNRPPEHRTATNSEQGLPHYVRPTSTCRKVTKKQIIRQLSVVASSCRDAQQQNQVTLAENHSLTKKVAKSKEVAEGLRTCLNHCRREMRSTKHDLVKALQDNVATKNDALSQEQEHQSLIAAMEKDAQATLEQVKRGHSLSMAKIISKSESKLAATEMKHKRAESITEMKHKRVVNNIEIEHKREVNIITKRDRVTINAKENLHALELEIKSNEINVSPPFHIVAFLPSFTHTTFLQELIKKHDNTRMCRDKKLHRKQQVAKDKKYARLLAAKEVKHAKRQAAKDEKYSELIANRAAEHDKIVTDLHEDFTDELRKSDAKVLAAVEQYQKLKRDYNAVLDDIKINHRSSFRKQQILHAQVIERKNETVKKMLRDMEDTREMLWETFNEMDESKRAVRMASTSAEKVAAYAERVKGKSSMLYTKLKESSCLINILKDEINDEQRVILELRSKVDEYEAIIDSMEQEYEDECNNHQTKITSIEAYYEEIILKQSPRHVMKRWVKNKQSRGKYIACPCYLFFG